MNPTENSIAVVNWIRAFHNVPSHEASRNAAGTPSDDASTENTSGPAGTSNRRNARSSGRISAMSNKAMQQIAASIREFQGYEAGNRDGEKELPDDRLQIGQAAGKGIDRHDVPVTRGGQRGEAEIQHGRHLLRIVRRGYEVDERIRA